ncbi:MULTISPECIES: dual specificity protein phosphatase family protein [unclassified Paenibacillus]|uniref:protein-tyrosine phosphatase family protein n=1 Tax=unclassified Paenibacillus TaxID=185978 RepID=UPI001AE886B9|nr:MULTISPECIES: dual specificity protein phosphatase family protein [unclassified Paenibacillus]MBP1156479.1 protein-tyrosine phosphatase [Paenibacillus sp. PvP091]MBP1168135.1 protein-tyrosine phosphatase [Paenibacillus sp. PvR098]MBP2439163.1 protein-tyrosine phosphatase [Paenibacillus sp. PvP052]
MEKNYQSLLEDKIFFGGTADVKDMVKNEGVEVIVDLRGEATECADPTANAEWIQVPLGDNAEAPQDQLLQQAINHVVEAYNSGKKVGFHCGGGGGRAGAVAVGTLITLGKSQTIDEAEAIAKSIRPKVNIKPPQREALEKIFNKGFNS